MPRSGTSLVEQILASHPDVHAQGELDDIGLIFESLPAAVGIDSPVVQCLDSLTGDMLDGLARRYLDRIAGNAGKARRVTDKMPHNFLYLGLIDLLFPRARVLHCVRDPLDTCVSCYVQQLGEFHAYAGDLANLGRYYRQYRHLMAHWKSALRLPMLEVCYEDLVADQRAVTESMLEFCGLGWDDRVLRFYESGRLTVTQSYQQVRRPMYQSSVGRWKNYNKFLGPLKEALGDIA
jgi:hypothetical protein